MGRTMVEFFRTDSTSCWTDAPQNTTETKVENRMPAPYSQQMAGKEYKMTYTCTCALSERLVQRATSELVPQKGQVCRPARTQHARRGCQRSIW